MRCMIVSGINVTNRLDFGWSSNHTVQHGVYGMFSNMGDFRLASFVQRKLNLSRGASIA